MTIEYSPREAEQNSMGGRMMTIAMFLISPMSETYITRISISVNSLPPSTTRQILKTSLTRRQEQR